MYNDTIAAIATPPGQGGIGIVRLSGAETRRVFDALFVPSARGRGRRRALRHGHVVDPETGRPVDEVMAVLFPAPRTYTREDMAEIQAHGGAVPLQRILSLCLEQGVRLARPGEFTFRAFINGRISLDQAEAVLDVIQSRTETGLRLAVQQMEGHLAGRVRVARGRVMDSLAHLTACLDFPEDEAPPGDPAATAREALQEAEGLLATADRGVLVRQGVRVALVGRPNVGKSSLLNALLRQNRAIVTPLPGTTRDTIEETASLAGLQVVLTDTAGLGVQGGEVESLGMERSRQALAAADLALLVLDGSEPLTPADGAAALEVQGRGALVVVNKADLPERLTDAEAGGLLPGVPVVRVSALTGQGLAELEDAVAAAALGGPSGAGAPGVVAAGAGEEALVSSPRHRDALRRAAGHLRDGLAALGRGDADDCATIDLTAAANALGEITGETAGDELLEAIFSRFCIGK